GAGGTASAGTATAGGNTAGSAATTAGSADSGTTAATAANSAGDSPADPDEAELKNAIERGLQERAANAAMACLKKSDPLVIINDILIPALDKVGKGFEAGTVFLPQLLMSAEASKSAFSVIKESLADTPRETKGRIILATVKGDIHDIGKNIVKVLLENYGYEIIDLGKDVAPETIVDTAISENIKLVGLSALMTTTVTAMEETIRQLRQKAPDVKVCVGGAVLTQEYADQIGADGYAKDAMATVHYADSVFSA
ncbi:MAG: cobalamin-dependent protein, partial [Lachnospiraceae bacterium]|nr:cobalamin-dependent protein [Lachnospiraceae bacterium]